MAIEGLDIMETFRATLGDIGSSLGFGVFLWDPSMGA